MQDMGELCWGRVRERERERGREGEGVLGWLGHLRGFRSRLDHRVGCRIQQTVVVHSAERARERERVSERKW